jgi:hypothetical protein
MHTLVRKTAREWEIDNIGLTGFRNTVRLSRSQLLGVLERARNLKARQPGAESSLTYVAGTDPDDVVVELQRPVEVLAYLLTMKERSGLRWERISFCCVGDGSSDIVASLMLTGALLGMDVRIVASGAAVPTDAVSDAAHDLAARHHGSLLVTADRERALRDARFVVSIPYTQGVAPTLAESLGSDDPAAPLCNLVEEESVNRVHVMEAVLAEWLTGGPGSTWSSPDPS